MDSKRQQKYSKLILEEMADIFLRNGKEVFGNAFITLSGVRVSPDLGIIRVYVALEFIENKEELLGQLNQNTSFFRGHLGKRLRNSMRIIPEIRFFEDDSWQEATKIDTLLKNLNIPPASTEE
jgi:ribosome-binding factor A